jgi:mutator protein MutT
MKKRYKQIAASYLILKKKDKLLLLRRANTGFMDGKYSLIAGHIEKNETARESIVREAKEEIGIIIQPKDIKLVHLMHRQEYEKPSEKRFCLFWLASRWRGKPAIIEKDKADNLKWFPTKKLPANIISYVKQAILKAEKKILYSEFEWKKKPAISRRSQMKSV